MTNRLAAYVIDKLRDERSFTGVSREVDLSVSTVIRIFDLVSYPKSRLPQVLSIDEFKGNTWGEKYQCILTEPVNKVVLDILPKRYEHYLSSYFNGFSREERSTVKYFVSDMWKPYSLVCDSWFRNAVPVIDKYHWIRQAIWAFEKVRKEEQKKLSPELRKYFKRSRSLLLKRYDGLTDEQKQEANVMLYYSANISRAHWYKEQLQKILALTDPLAAKKALIEWMNDADGSEPPAFVYCANTLRSWSAGIINSFFTSVGNNVFMIGRLVHDPELKTTQSGKTVVNTSIAVDRPRVKDTVDFFNIVVWGPSAEYLGRYAKKGSRIGIEGTLTNRSYTAKDGTKRTITEIVCDDVKILDSNKKVAGSNEHPAAQEPVDYVPAEPDIGDLEDDELPF